MSLPFVAEIMALRMCGMRRKLNEIAPGFKCPAEHKPSAEYDKPPVSVHRILKDTNRPDLPLGQPIKRGLVDRQQPSVTQLVGETDA
jgi:hypothetical protein